MDPKIEVIPPKQLIGMRTEMTLATDTTRSLWQAFMPRRGEVNHRINADYLSVQRYDDSLKMADFTPDTRFEKWAAVEVSAIETIPQGMASHRLTGGQYAVFMHHGPASAFPNTLQWIYGRWLPSSGYQLDNREHFEILGPDYRPDDPNAVEAVWIPIKR